MRWEDAWLFTVVYVGRHGAKCPINCAYDYWYYKYLLDKMKSHLVHMIIKDFFF